MALDPADRVLAVVARTNNVAEHFFAACKQKLRKRLGRAHLGRDMEDQPAQAALAANLLHPDYVRVACGTLDRLPHAFAELDRQAITATTPLQRNNKDAELRRRIRVWAADDELCFPSNQQNCPRTPANVPQQLKSDAVATNGTPANSFTTTAVAIP